MKPQLNRKPVVSGRFYPSNADELTKTLNSLFKKHTNTESYNKVLALISPHAGYVFSGEVAAEAFAKINPNKSYQNIFVLAPSHHVSFNGASIYNVGNYETPLGEVEINYEIAADLINKNRLFTYYDKAHSHEHSLEVLLPFLQHWLNTPFKLVPIVIGTHDTESIKEIAKNLKPYFHENNLFVISSDFSHFPNYNDAIKADERMSKAILTKSVKNTLLAVEENQKENMKNLATSACGISGIYALLNIIEDDSTLEIKKVKYLNSGDSKYGDPNKVVGYLSFIIHEKTSSSDDFTLSETEKKQLLEFARKALENKLKGKSEKLSYEGNSEKLLEKYGVFVSLHNNEKLRGCIGRFDTDEPLYKLVQKMAIASALSDSRFSNVEAHEMDEISLEISVLSPLTKINSIDEIIIGKHGIYIKQGFNKGTLLPQVATHNNWSALQFLNYCSEHKAGIGKNGWKNADIYIYTAEVFSE